MTDVSFIIVEYKDTISVEHAVRSILSYDYELSFDIIVLSNSAYPPKDQSSIQSRNPGAQFVFNQDNRGFGKAVNQGILRSSGEFVVLLNPDARVLDTSLWRAVDFLTRNNKVACVGPMIIDDSGQIQDSCRTFLTPAILLQRIIRRFLGLSRGEVLEEKDYSVAHQVDWLSGACIMARRKAIKQTGLLYERYFMYIEDMDWCRCFWQAGWEVWYLPEWKVVHNAGRASTTGFSLSNRLMWIHLASLLKYYYKWGLTAPRISVGHHHR